jgi:hypothetical protein
LSRPVGAIDRYTDAEVSSTHPVWTGIEVTLGPPYPSAVDPLVLLVARTIVQARLLAETNCSIAATSA